MTGWHDPARAVLTFGGPDVSDFLQGLITNDIKGLVNGPVYAALLTPQGKYLFDFILCQQGEQVLLDVAADQADALMTRLAMYRLRSKVTIGRADLIVLRGVGEGPVGAVADPRHPALGWRAYVAPGDYPLLADGQFDAAYVEHLIPRTGRELIANDSYILEMGFERLNGVNFRKGCYVGQEVTARMKHKTELRKGLGRVHLAAPVPVGSDISRDGKVIGQVYSQANGKALAYLRFDQIGEGMTAAGVTLSAD